MLTDFDDWFIREILVHEGSLIRFLRHYRLDRDELHDLRQEVYTRVYEAAARNRPSAPKAFLLTTARHLMIDRARRSRVVSIEPMGDFEPSNVYFIDDVTPERWLDARQTLKRLTGALNRLPDRCREVVWLRRVEQLSQKEVARRLGISEKTVEKQLAKGARVIADNFFGNGSLRKREFPKQTRPATEKDDGHAR